MPLSRLYRVNLDGNLLTRLLLTAKIDGVPLDPRSRIPAHMLTYFSRRSRWFLVFAYTSALAAQTAVLQPLLRNQSRALQ